LLIRSGFGAALALVAVIAAAPAGAAEVRIATLPGTGWQVTDVAPTAGWTSVGYDTAGWVEPTVLTALEASPGAPLLSPPAGQERAHMVWMGGASPGGTGGPDHIYLRNEFSLDAFALGQALNSLAQMQVDDDFALYVNGNLVYLNADQGFADRIFTLSFGNYLRAGELNVIAIEAVDGQWGSPHDRGLQDVQFDATISSGVVTVPEPASAGLAALGLAGLAGLGRLRRRS